jgi:hypothetical protein
LLGNSLSLCVQIIKLIRKFFLAGCHFEKWIEKGGKLTSRSSISGVFIAPLFLPPAWKRECEKEVEMAFFIHFKHALSNKAS